MGGRKWVRVSAALFSPAGVAAMSTDHLGCRVLFIPFLVCGVRISLPGRSQGDGVGGLLHPGNPLSGAGGLWNSVLLCPNLGSSLVVCQPPGLIAVSVLLVCQWRVHPSLHCCRVCWGRSKCQTVQLLSLPFLVRSPALALIHSLPDVSVRGSQTCLC